MTNAYVSELSKHVGKEVTIKGWLYNNRSSGKIQFMQVRDGTGIVQCVFSPKDVGEETFKACDKLPQESSLAVTGSVREDKRAPGGYELTVKAVQIFQQAEPYPIALQEHGVGFLMEQRHLWLRSKKQVAVLKIRAEIIRAIRDFFDNNGFTLVDTPILTPAACEGTTTLFEVTYFDDKAYLTQSGQLYNEANAMALGKVYCFGPTFRAEKSKTRKHLMEFWMVEPEVAYAELNDIMDLAENFVEYIVQRVLEKHQENLKVLERDTKPLEKVRKPFPRVAYSELMKSFDEWKHPFKKGDDLGAPEESVIGQKFDKPVLIHRFPMAVKAFYMKPDPADPTYALCVDMIAPEGYGEIIGGGQREDDVNKLTAKIKECKLPMASFEWYLDLRRYGSVPHGGFGLGVERTVAWICGREHIRECIPYPRMLYKIYP
ncbi:MAG: asparagine--tRNA ligase [Planctomycetes bacterium]|nr:asparagine--tRNA ligase [Planctomycetota bacterium]